MLVVDVTELCCGCELKPTDEPATAATAATAANGVSAAPGELGRSPEEAELLLDTLEEPAAEAVAPPAEAVAPDEASAEAAAAAAEAAGEAALVAEAEVGTSSS